MKKSRFHFAEKCNLSNEITERDSPRKERSSGNRETRTIPGSDTRQDEGLASFLI